MSQPMNKDKSEGQRKSRTPSGTEIQNTVKGIRKIFSPDDYTHSASQSNQSSESPLSPHPQVLQGRSIALTPRSSEHKRKQTDDEHDKGYHDQSAKILKQSCLKLIGNKLKLHKIKEHSSEDSDSEFFATPPATPNRPRRSKRVESKLQPKLNMADGQIQMEIETAKPTDATDNTSNSASSMFQSIFKEVAQQHSETIPTVIEEGSIGEIPQTLDVRAVHLMFKQLETKFEERLAKMENSRKTTDAQDTTGTAGEDYSKVCQNLQCVKMKNKALSSAICSMWEEIEDLSARLGKVEITNNRKSILITGLYTDDDKESAVKQVQDFIEKWFNFTPQVEDLYWLGSSTPRAIVVVLQSSLDKDYILENKAVLKDALNEDKRKIFIKNLLRPSEKAKRKKEWEIQQRNDQRELEEGQEELQIQFKKGILYANGVPVQQIKPPNPQDIVELSTTKLDEIFQLEVKEGPRLENQGNIFTAYTAAASSMQQVHDLYLKMRLSFPKARHIIAAFYIPGAEEHVTVGYCDDGEHEAGTRLLQILQENNMIYRVLFVTRHYAQKIGPDRFGCIERAASVCLMQYPLNDYTGEMQHLGQENAEDTPSEQDTSIQKSLPQENLNKEDNKEAEPRKPFFAEVAAKSWKRQNQGNKRTRPYPRGTRGYKTRGQRSRGGRNSYPASSRKTNVKNMF